jgi:FkbM family methyltransferase
MFIKKFLKYKKKPKPTELERLQAYPTQVVGYTDILGPRFKFHDSLSFLVTYKEIFKDEIYRFPSGIGRHTILDCGANMGLSTIFFAINYPQHHIIAFEPQEDIYEVLKENVMSFGLQNVELIKAAVWTKHDILKFFTDGTMGGRVNNSYKGQIPKLIQALPLIDFLSEDVEFLKLDIEGAEDEVLRACIGKLDYVKYLFFEYHNKVATRQHLHELLELVAKAGFTYFIKESAVRQRPYMEDPIICESFDMALNVFCYKR